MATYLVTGAAGFIAAKVCELLLDDGHIVVGVDNLNSYYDVRIKDYRLAGLLRKADWLSHGNSCESQFATGAARSGNFHFFPVDIEHLPLLKELFSNFRFDAVFNLAARAGVRSSMDNPFIYLSTNTLGTLNILECMRGAGVKKLILASTSSLYAGSALPFTEDLPVNTPLSPYAATKKAAELMAYSYNQLYGIDVSVVRYFTVFGPAGRPDMAPFRFLHWMSTGQSIRLFGDGEQSRDFTYIDDAARGTILAAKHCGFEIVNIGGGNAPISINKLILLFERYSMRTAMVDRSPANAIDMLETQANIEKAKRLFNWAPRTTIEQGVQNTANWYLANEAWLKNVRV